MIGDSTKWASLGVFIFRALASAVCIRMFVLMTHEQSAIAPLHLSHSAR